VKVIVKKYLIAWSLMALSSSAYAGQKVGAELQKYVNQLKTFKADFVQSQADEARFTLTQSTGHFMLERPGNLSWEYYQPEEQKIVVEGRNLWVHDLDLEQVSVRPISDVKADLPISWLLYDEPIQDNFTIIESGDMNGVTWFNLTPKSATYFQSIEVSMQDGEMKEVWMYQSEDNITKVRFNNIESNGSIPHQNFQFSIPDGTDLVGTPL